MASQIADYQVTGRFPFRDPKDRLQNVGKGFSKMLKGVQSPAQKLDRVQSQSTLDRVSLMTANPDLTINRATNQQLLH